MNRAALLLEIKTFLARFETFVRLSNLSNEFDINKISENFIIPIFKLAYGWDLLNLNDEKKNAKALDLIDNKRKIGIQVTSDTSNAKIKETLKKFVSSEYEKRVNKVYMYFLKLKQTKNSITGLNSITQRKIKFTKENLIDNADLYNKISSLRDRKKIVAIHELLRTEFSDISLKKEMSLREYEEFKQKYRDCCINMFSRLNFFGLSIPKRPREVELYSLFVEPSFSRASYEHLEPSLFEQNVKIVASNHVTNKPFSRSTSFKTLIYSSYFELPLKNLFNGGNHIVILGKPGAGKSSLIKYSICKLASEDKAIFKNSLIYDYLPFRIELHKYNRFKKEHQGGILEYLTYNLIEDFQISFPKEKVEYLVSKFPMLLFFDGLDEIFDIQERVTVRNDIENFISNNPIHRSVVTSRYESYEEVSLNHSKFVILNVGDFNNNQIEEYVNKWYNIEESTAYVRNIEIKSCIEQLRGITEELKENPLLLSLILILYRNEQDIPTTKLEIYEGCAQTIVDTRDNREKRLNIKLKTSNQIAIFSAIAYWQFANEISGNFKIDHTAVKNFISSYLVSKGEFEDMESASDAAKEFLEYAKLRSIYIENKFAHKTFYEYFTSYFIYTNFYTKPKNQSELEKILIDNIGLSSWHVVLELLVSKIDQYQGDYEIIDLLIDKLFEKKPQESAYFFSSVLKSLRNVSPNKSRMVIDKICYYLTENSIRDGYEKPLLATYFENLCSLLRIDKYKDAFVRNLESTAIQRSLSDNMYELLYEIDSVTETKEIKEFLRDVPYSGDNRHLSAKFFLLMNIEKIEDQDKCEAVFNRFISKYGNDYICTVFSSTFGQVLFGGVAKFSWVTRLLMAVNDMNKLNELDAKLESLGIQEDKILKALKGASIFRKKILRWTMPFKDGDKNKKSRLLGLINKAFKLKEKRVIYRDYSGNVFYNVKEGSFGDDEVN
ncbi:MAG: SMEK domain-containing protein [Chitinophagaceae bacterium]